MKAATSHFSNNNDSAEASHGINNLVLSKNARRGMRTAEGIGLAKACNLSAALLSGEITEADIDEAQKLTTERRAKMGSQTEEAYRIDAKYEDERRRADMISKRAERREKKEALQKQAEALLLICREPELACLTVANLKLQLKAWDFYMNQRKLPRDGVDVRLSGNKDVILEKVRLLLPSGADDMLFKVKALVKLFGGQASADQEKLINSASSESVIDAVIDAASMVDVTDVEPDEEPTDDDVSAMTGIIDNPWGDQGEDGFASGTMG
jgi:hypothetical protein